MIDEKPFRCATCFQEVWFPVYDQERKIYVCPKCCEKVGHEPPFTPKEYWKLTKDKDGV